MNDLSFEQSLKLAKYLLGNNLSHLEIGKNNWVFDGGNRILMIPKHKRVRDYKIRIRATQELISYGIPVPRVLEYSPKKEDFPEYLIVEKINGEHIRLSRITEKERSSIHESAGEILREIHQIPCEGFGRLDASMIGTSISWKDFTDSFFMESLKRLSKTEYLFKKYGEKVQEEYERGLENIINLSKPNFLHADYHIENLLFKSGRVVAVMDLDIVSGGDQAWDTGHYCHTFNFDRLNGSTSFRKGYGNNMDYERERIYLIIIWTRKIGSQAIDRPDSLNETIPEFEKILRGEI